MQTVNFEPNEKKILYINFNQDYTCLCVGTEGGYSIYNVEKFTIIFIKKKHERNK